MFLSIITAPICWRIQYYVRVAYSRNEQSFRQYIGAGINPIDPAFLIIPSRSFWLSGHPSFLAIPADRSVWPFSGHSGH
jgi:hypothetical protein